MAAFIMWCVGGAAFILLGIYDIFSKKTRAFGFWANAKTAEVNDIKAYNRALGKLWIVYGVFFILLGIPLLGGQNSPLAIVTIIGSMAEAIVVMAVYILVIEKKYRKR